MVGHAAFTLTCAIFILVMGAVAVNMYDQLHYMWLAQRLFAVGIGCIVLDGILLFWHACYGKGHLFP